MIKIAIIGAGFMGQNHADAYNDIKDAEVVAVYDKNEQLAKEFAIKTDCLAFTDFEEMAEKVAFDVADICLPTYLHEEYTIRSAQKGKHIFCEKPVTLSVDSLDRMIAETEKAGVKMMVGQVLRFWPEYVEAKRRYQSKELGELNYVFAARLSEHPAWSSWYRLPQNSGGGLLDLHLHDIDFLCWMLGKVESVYAAGKKNADGCWNFVNSTLRFPSGISASAQGVIEMEKGYPFTMELRLAGSNQTYEYAMRSGANLENRESSQRRTAVYEKGKIIELPVEERDPYTIELEHFVQCIAEKRDSDVISMEQVREVLCTIEALRVSLKTGEVVRVDYRSPGERSERGKG